MEGALAPILATLFAWWFSTGVLIWLVGLPRHTHRWTAAGMSGLMTVAMVAVLWLRNETGIAAAYTGFLVGLALWAWHETMFLLGLIAGPRRTPCPDGLRFWPRFVASTETVIHHEVGIAIHGGVLIALSWGAANQVALWTYLLLWLMRLTAKLVVFLGAPNISDKFLPNHLTYLSTYFGKRRVTVFFPVLITLATALATVLTYRAVTAHGDPFLETGYLMVATLAWLAILEHWALVLPVPDAALFKWFERDETSAPPTTEPVKDMWRT